MKEGTIKWFWDLLKQSLKELQKNDPLRLSSSTAFFATFSLIPTIVLLLEVAGIIFRAIQIKERVFNVLQQMFGTDVTNQLGTILENVQSMQEGLFTTIGVLIFLMFVITTLFQVLHNSFNEILRVKLKGASLTMAIKSRGFFLIIIFCGGILFFATVILDVILNFAGNQVIPFLETSPAIFFTLNRVLSMALLTVWLALIYKYLPDMILPWKPVWMGSIITTILAFIGQFILGKIMITSSLNTIYGSSASIVLVLLFIFYLSFILYYGVCLIKVYAEKGGYELKSTNHAVRYEIKETE